MITYTNTQLKQALAKMLPDIIYFGTITKQLEWHNVQLVFQPVLDTELLHLCWLVEETLPNNPEQYDYYHLLDTNTHATWQQRTIVLAKVKGIEL